MLELWMEMAVNHRGELIFGRIFFSWEEFWQINFKY
jgi:hypothetical protein